MADNTIVTTQLFTKQELKLIVEALECKFDCDNDTCTEPLWEMERESANGYTLTPNDIQQARTEVNTNINNLLILQQLQVRLGQALTNADNN